MRRVKLPPPEENFGALEIFAPFTDVIGINYDLNAPSLRIYNPDTEAGRALLSNLVYPSSEEAQQPEIKAKLESVYSQLVIGKDRPHAKFPFRSGAHAVLFEPILNWSIMGDLVVWHFNLAAADKNHTTSAEAAQTLLQLLRLQCATEFLPMSEFTPGREIELLDDLENILDSGLRNSLFSQAFLKDFAGRLQRIEVLGSGKKSVATFYCFYSEISKAFKSKAEYEPFIDGKYRHFDWPFFPWEDQVVKMCIFLIPEATYQLHLLELNKFNWECTVEPLQELRPKPMPPKPNPSLHTFLMANGFSELSSMNIANTLFVAQTRLNLLKSACEMEAIRLGGDVSREDAFKQIQTRDYFNGGKPLRASHDPDGSVVIYSTGLDGKDDGGTPDLDITIRLPALNWAE